MDKILCACSAYNNKYWFNPKYEKIPLEIKNKIKAMCVLFVEEVGGIISLRFDDKHNLFIDINHNEADYLYDSIGAKLEIKRLQDKYEELFMQLQMFDYSLEVYDYADGN